MPHLSPFVVHGSFAFFSGQLGWDQDRVLPDGIAAQTTQCLENIRATLTEAGLDPADIVKTTVFLTEKRDYAAFDEAYAAFLGANKPARSTVIAQLAIDGALIEIEVVAAIGDRQPG